MQKMPRGVWMLGFVSLFMDMSSEMTHSLLPLFLTGSLGASVALVGLIDGAAEAFAQIVKMFSGVASDYMASRKWLAVLGYGLSAFTKPLFPIASTPMAVLVARLADRLGKGIRGAPRDALVADYTPPEMRGAAYGLRQSLDTLGAVAGPLIAVGLLAWQGFEIRHILWVACLPAVVAVLLLVFFVHEPERRTGATTKRGLRQAFGIVNPGRGFWSVLVLGCLLSTARMTEAFLVLKAQAAGLPLVGVPLVMVLMSFVYFLASWPAGKIADRLGVRGLLGAGLISLVVADLLLAFGPGVALMLAGVSLWGLHMGLTQGLLNKMVAEAAPVALRGTCFGYFNLACGLATLVSGVVAGLLWDERGATATFIFGACMALVTLGALAIQPRLSNQ